MISKIITKFHQFVAGIKSEVKSHKFMYGLALCVLLIGALTAVAVGVDENEQSLNFLAGGGSAIGYILALAIACTAIFAVVYFSTYHFFVYVCVFPLLVLVVNLSFRVAFKSILIDGLLGAVFLLFFILPIIILNILIIIRLLYEIYYSCGYSCNKFKISHMGRGSDRLKKLILKSYIKSLIITYAIWTLEYIIVVIAT